MHPSALDWLENRKKRSALIYVKAITALQITTCCSMSPTKDARRVTVLSVTHVTQRLKQAGHTGLAYFGNGGSLQPGCWFTISREAEILELCGPVRVGITQALDIDAAREAAFNRCLDELGSEKRERER